MSEVLRLVLLVGVAGAAVTLLTALAAWFMAEDRRLARAFRNVLGQPPDAVVIAHGHGCGAAMALGAGQIAVAWNAGAWCLVYRLDELLGAEVFLDGAVAGRVQRGEPRMAVNRGAGTGGEVRLRLLFDDPLHPDFDLVLWPTPSVRRGAPAKAAEAVSEANRWLARTDAVLRRTGVAAVKPAPAPPPTRAARPSAPQQEDLFSGAEEEDELEDDGPPF